MTGVNQTPHEDSHPDQAHVDPDVEVPTGAESPEHPETPEHDLPEETPQTATVYSCSTENQRAVAIKHAQQVLASDGCVVMPTDTVYGIAANAFSAAGVEHLLNIKGRNRTMPPPVLIAHVGVLDGLADEVSDAARALAEAFWPGGLTLICHAQPSLQWDLGETRGTVALRVPDDDVAVELLSNTGPLAVSSANRTGLPAATSADQAKQMLGDKVEVYLNAGNRGKAQAVPNAGSSAHPVIRRNPVASTIVDCTGETPVVVREGAITVAQLREVVPSVIGLGGTTDGEPDSASGAEGAERNGGSDSVAEPAESTEIDAGSPEDTGVDGGPGVATDATSDVGAGAEEDGSAAPAERPDEVVSESSDDAAETDIILHPEPESFTEAEHVPEPTSRAVPVNVSVPGHSQAAMLVAGGVVSGRAVPDQNRRRKTPRRESGQVQPVDRATAAALVARGTVDETVGAESADQARAER